MELHRQKHETSNWSSNSPGSYLFSHLSPKVEHYSHRSRQRGATTMSASFFTKKPMGGAEAFFHEGDTIEQLALDWSCGYRSMYVPHGSTVTTFNFSFLRTQNTSIEGFSRTNSINGLWNKGSRRTVLTRVWGTKAARLSWQCCLQTVTQQEK